MKKKIPVEKLLRWRFEIARDKAPPAPAAARLLAAAGPWWETSPERFQSVIQRLDSIQIAHVQQMSQSPQSRTGVWVPALIIRASKEFESAVRILDMSLSKGGIQLSFQCETEAADGEQTLEVTLVSASTWKPLFWALVAQSPKNEYWLSAKLPDDVAKEWERLKVTDRIPFRLILRSMENPT